MYEDHWTKTKDLKHGGASSRAPLSVPTISWRCLSSPWPLPPREGQGSSCKRVSSLLLQFPPASGGNGHLASRGKYTGVGESAAQTAGEELVHKGMLAVRDFWSTC